MKDNSHSQNNYFLILRKSQFWRRISDIRQELGFYNMNLIECQDSCNYYSRHVWSEVETDDSLNTIYVPLLILDTYKK